MKSLFKTHAKPLWAAPLAVLALAAVLVAPPLDRPAYADTTNYPVSTPGVVLIPLHLDGQFTATTADVATIKLPFKAKVIGVSATASASGGTSPTLTVDVQDDGTSILDSAVSVTAGTVAEATLDSTKVQVADESEISLHLTIGGTSPTWDDIDVLITVLRN